MGEMFDANHVWYIVISLTLTELFLWAGKRFLKTARGKDLFLKTFAFSTFLLHISIMWVDFLRNGSATAYDNILFPKYFCNFCMYMLLIVSLWENKKSKTFQAVAVFTAYGGFFGAMISLIYPDYYLGAPNMFEWSVFKSLLSHSTMLVGSLWIFVGGYIPIRRSNAILYFGGLLGSGALGLIVNWLFAKNGLPDPNAMYLHHPPLAEAPFLNCYTIAALMVLVIFLFTHFYVKATKKDRKPGKRMSFFFENDDPNSKGDHQ